MVEGTPTGGAEADLVLVREAATQTGVSAARIYRWISAGQLPATSSAHGKRVDIAALRALIEARTAEPAAEDTAFLPTFRAARVAGVSPARVRYWVKRGLLEAQPGTHGMLVRPADVRACAEKLNSSRSETATSSAT